MLDALIIIFAVVLIILCLMQSGNTDDVVSALSGQSSNLFATTKERGPELYMSRATFAVAIVFMVLIVMRHI